MVKILKLLITPTFQTLYMVFAASAAAFLLGLIPGIALVLTRPKGLWECSPVYRTLDVIVNVLRSFPFIILMIILFPATRALIGTSIGTTAAIVPLAVSAAPFFARVVQNSLSEVDDGIIEAAVAMGAPVPVIVRKIMIPEAMPSLISGITLMVIALVGSSAMAGAVGGGGLGDTAIRFGFHRFRSDVLTASVLVIIALVQIIQAAGNAAVRHCLKKR